MRRLLVVFIAFFMSVACPAQAGMRLTLVMVTPQQFSQVKDSEDVLTKTLFESSHDVALGMDKEWHGIHYLLTGSPYSAQGVLGQAILGGSEFGTDLGYGPARYISPREVSSIATALKNLPIEQFKMRYDPEAMTKAEIYPGVWEREGQEGLKWLITGFEQLREFYDRAAAKGMGIVLVIL